MARKPIDFFGDDSPLFAKTPPPKKKVVKKKIPVKRRTKVNLDDLFNKTETVEAPKKRGPKSNAELEEEAIVAENKRVATRNAAREKKLPKKVGKVYPKVASPEDCKNILPAFKERLITKWKLLKNGTHNEAASVASYISGVMTVCKETRPKEYDELFVLRAIAKKISNERN